MKIHKNLGECLRQLNPNIVLDSGIERHKVRTWLGCLSYSFLKMFAEIKSDIRNEGRICIHAWCDSGEMRNREHFELRQTPIK